MGRFFNLDNPVWRFIGNIADMFLLSIYWYICCIPIFTIGCGTTAMYYVTLKLTSNQEGYTTSSYWRAFKNNLKQGILIWLLCLLAGTIIGIDIYWSLLSGSTFSMALLPPFLVIALVFLLFLAFIFPLLARAENNTKTLLRICFVMSIRNFLPVFSTILVTVAFFAIGIFVFWPLLLIAPGFSAYLNSYIFNRIFEKYHMNLE